MSKRQGWGLVILGLVLGLGLWAWIGCGPDADRSRQSPSLSYSENSAAKNSTTRPQKSASTPTDKKEAPGSFLEAFGGKEGSESEPVGPVLTDAELEKRYHQAERAFEEGIQALTKRVEGWKGIPNREEYQAALAERKQLIARRNKETDSLQKELVRARKARPDAAVPQWLTGELLLRVGGEPEQVLPYLHRAVALGLSRPHLFASLAHAQTEANQLEQAYQSARKALELDSKDRYVWEKFSRAAFNVEHFAEISARLQKAFADKLPSWAEPMRKEAEAQQALWQVEQKLRVADAKAGLPRIRLVIEHRRFARHGKDATSQIEVTGRDEVVVELFASQTPQAVADFLGRIRRKVYNGRRIYLAEPARLAALGDPDSKAGLPPDELKSGPAARGFFRGTLGIVTTGPPSAAMPFFITFAPMPQMNGRFLALGRIIQGQAGLERITLGRISRDLGHFGPLIPGDLLVQAEVLPQRTRKNQEKGALPARRGIVSQNDQSRRQRRTSSSP